MDWTKENFLAKLQCAKCNWKKEMWFEGRDTTTWDIPECCGTQVGATEVTAYFRNAEGQIVEASSKESTPVVVAREAA